jgi:hypothetical protein
MESKKILLSAAVAGLVIGGSAFASDGYKSGKDSVHCQAVNSCKGTGDCGGKTHGCAGQNTCKGKGWKKLSKKDCDKATAALKEKDTKEMKMDKKADKKS